MSEEYGLASPNKDPERRVIGLIPAAGKGTRLAPLPCSKELYPIGLWPNSRGHNLTPKVVSHYLLEKMELAGIIQVYIIIREGKWDIPAYFGNGSVLNMNLAYLMMGPPFGVPYTLDQAYPFIKNAVVALGFPDIIFDPDYAFVKVLARLAASNLDVVLGLCPAGRPQKMDMVDVHNDGRIKQLFIKPEKTKLHYSWAIAVWRPTFTDFMHKYLAASEVRAAQESEMFVGDVFNAAIKNGLKIDGVPISDKPYLDIGTGDDLLKAIRSSVGQLE
jgi:glucose-1-phosphate thymidylyltransferase